MSSVQGLYYPFSIIQGETFEFSFEFNIDGIAQFYDEYIFVGRVRDSDNALISVLDLQFSESDTNAELTDVLIPSNETQIASEDVYTYEIKATNVADGKVITIFYGPFTIKSTMIL